MIQDNVTDRCYTKGDSYGGYHYDYNDANKLSAMAVGSIPICVRFIIEFKK